MIDQKMSADDIERVIPYLYKDRVLSCISNFAYCKSQIVLGDAQLANEVGQRWLQLEEQAMAQIQLIDAEVEANINLIE